MMRWLMVWLRFYQLLKKQPDEQCIKKAAYNFLKNYRQKFIDKFNLK